MPWLMLETGNRCAYSRQHIQRAEGKFEVDHFDPTLKLPGRNLHGNLLPASRHCNSAKWKHWPKPHQKALGARYLNPYVEQDYGDHLLENPVTHELEARSVAGVWHIEKLDLNAPHLVRERKQRAAIWKRLSTGPLEILDFQSAVAAAKLLREQFDEMIPLLPEVGPYAD